jgi:bacteriorhodopsin
MFSAILILLLLPITDVSRSRGKHVESPFIEFGQISTVLYFLYFTVVMYGVTLVENTFVDLRHKK